MIASLGTNLNIYPLSSPWADIVYVFNSISVYVLIVLVVVNSLNQWADDDVKHCATTTTNDTELQHTCSVIIIS